MNATEMWARESVYKIDVIEQACNEVAGLVLCYRFCECRFAKPQYYVEISTATERSAAYLGEELLFARRIFRMLVHHTVTPCTLTDILQDAKNIHDSPLQI